MKNEFASRPLETLATQARKVEALSYATRGVINIRNCSELKSILSEDKNIILKAYFKPKVDSGGSFESGKNKLTAEGIDKPRGILNYVYAWSSYREILACHRLNHFNRFQ